VAHFGISLTLSAEVRGEFRRKDGKTLARLTSRTGSGESRNMDAAPRLVEIADAFAAAHLEAILIGNAAAALHGAPVTTLDFDFLYRASAGNEIKLRRVADLLGGHITQPFPAVSTVFRILREDSQLQIDLTSQVHGVKSFNSLRSKAVRVEIEGRTILVASLPDIIRSKREANRPQDLAVLHVLQRTLEDQENGQAGTA